MFRISCLFLVGFFCSVHCLQRQFLYSRLDKQVANSSLAVFLSGAASLAHCAGHCLVDEYCVEFLYNETSQRCIGLHCVQKESSSYQYVVLESLQCLHYEKGKSSFLNENEYPIILFYFDNFYSILRLKIRESLIKNILILWFQKYSRVSVFMDSMRKKQFQGCVYSWFMIISIQNVSRYCICISMNFNSVGLTAKLTEIVFKDY